jgi:hypothetical protein
MPTPEDEQLRAAMVLLEPKIVEFQARARDAAVQYPPDHPALRSLRHHLGLLQQERDRLRDELKQLDC